jgi:hypothetical protein
VHQIAYYPTSGSSLLCLGDFERLNPSQVQCCLEMGKLTKIIMKYLFNVHRVVFDNGDIYLTLRLVLSLNNPQNI